MSAVTVALLVGWLLGVGAGFWLGWRRGSDNAVDVVFQETSSDGKAQAELILCQARVVALERRLGDRT